MARISQFVLPLLSALLAAQATRTKIWPDKIFSELDTGLYWARANDGFEKASTTSPQGSIYFNVHRPTMIYIHGLQPGSVRRLHRPDFTRPIMEGVNDMDFAKLWRRRGYNVGILYWNQYSDATIWHTDIAEKTIWSTEEMKWMDSNGTFHAQTANQTVTHILLQSYMSAMRHYKGNHVRIVGHSLGNQLALRIAHLLNTHDHMTNKQMVPGRVSLLDPYYSPVNGAAENCAELVRQLAGMGVAIDTHMTTHLGDIGRHNLALLESTAYVRHVCDYYGDWDYGQFEAEKHSAATWLYFWSIKHSSAPVQGDNNQSMKNVVNARSTDAEVRRWMAFKSYVRQVEGETTYESVDDVFTLIDRDTPDDA